ncbi:MAG: hypothetical protein NTV80_15015, partial [Verrucomicrobia bacterium]|nr:hypothetical protein [Verrucomicrobiota bacterium]
EACISHGYQRATARDIDPASLKILLKGWAERRDWYAAHPEEAAKTITQGASKADTTLSVPDLAAYTTTAGVLLNLDRVVTRD